MTASAPIKVLLLEDAPEDAELVEHTLRQAGIELAVRRVDTRDAFRRALDEFDPDIVLSDYRLPGFDGLAAVEMVRRQRPELPVVAVTGVLGDEAAVALVKAGAADYVLKDRLARLPSAVERALAQAADRRARRRAEQELQYANIIVEESPVVLFRALAREGFPRVYVSRNVSRFGYTAEEAKAGAFAFPDFVHQDDRQAVLEALGRMTRGEAEIFELDYRAVIRDGSIRWVHDRSVPIRDGNGHIVAYQGMLIDITERKEAETALAQSEQKFRTLAEAAQDAIIIADASGAVIYWNPAAERILGYSAQEAIGSKVQDRLAPPRFRAAMACGLERFKETGRGPVVGKTLELAALRKDASEIPIELSLAAARLGGQWQAVAIMRDISERKRAEAALRRSHELLEMTERIAHVGGWEYDLAADAVVWSDETYRIFGRDREHWTPSLADLIAAVHPDDREMLRRAIAANATRSGPFEFEHRLLRPDGAERTVHVRAEPVRDAGGKVVAITGTCHDVTEQSRAAQRIREEEAKFRGLVEQNVAGIAIIGEDARVAYVNPYLAGLAGYAAAELIGRPLLDLVPEAERPIVGEHLRSQISGEEGLTQLAATMQTKSSGVRDIIVNASPAIFEGRPASIAVVLDITERKRAEAALHHSRQLIEGILDTIPVRVFWKDRRSVYLGCNAPFARDAGFAHSEDLLGKDDYQMGWRDQAEAYRRDDRAVIESGRPKLLIEELLTTPTGETLTILTSKTPLRDAKGEVVGVLGTYQDISERKAAERALFRMNRALRTLSRGNEVVVRAASEEALLRQMCGVIVDSGGFRMAWFGRLVHDARKSIDAVAWAGEIGDFFERASISWSDDPDNICPCGRAVRTGEPQVTQDFAADPALAPLQELALRYGFASCAALPLQNESGVFAVLAIYAREREAFDGDSLGILQELAADLAYGVRALRDRSEREAAEQRWRASLEATIGALASTAEMRDPYTAGHQQRVARLAVAIARELGLPESGIEGLYLAGIIHDVGKIAVPAEILSKPGKLTRLEYEMIQAHAQAGYDIVKGVEFPWPIAEIVLKHHERLDGSGYPRGIRGEAILAEARILAVADVVEAMMSRRPYREALGVDAALAEIAEGKAARYDAAAVDACIALFRQKGFRFQ